eukprot:GAHX01000108.1.p1 GENE.GAHX01000108.1~~GAHX01000108.1.p1  ORF type:complete len:410 (-),score=71.21 GAHX01000108.1:1839-3017(-)
MVLQTPFKLNDSLAHFNSPHNKDTDQNKFSIFLTNFYKGTKSHLSTHRSIFSYVLKLESKLKRPKTNIPVLPITYKHRMILVDWLISVHQKFKLKTPSLFLCIDILDCCLPNTKILKSELQTVGVAALLIASKIEEIHPPTLKNLEYISADACPVEKITEKESILCEKMKFDFSAPNLYTFVSHLFEVAVKPFFNFINSEENMKLNCTPKKDKVMNKKIKRKFGGDITNVSDVNSNGTSRSGSKLGDRSPCREKPEVFNFSVFLDLGILISEIYLLTYQNAYSHDYLTVTVSIICYIFDTYTSVIGLSSHKIQNIVLKILMNYLHESDALMKIECKDKYIDILEDSMNPVGTSNYLIKDEIKELVTVYMQNEKFNGIKDKHSSVIDLLKSDK